MLNIEVQKINQNMNAEFNSMIMCLLLFTTTITVATKPTLYWKEMDFC